MMIIAINASSAMTRLSFMKACLNAGGCILMDSKARAILHPFGARNTGFIEEDSCFPLQFGNGSPGLTTRIWWSVKVMSPLGSFTLGMWQLTQSALTVGQILAWI